MSVDWYEDWDRAVKFLEENVGDDKDSLLFILTCSAKELFDGRPEMEEHIEYLQNYDWEREGDLKALKRMCVRYELRNQQKKADAIVS